VGRCGVRRQAEAGVFARRASRGGAAPEGRGDCGDHGRDSGIKKNVLGLEDYGQLPAELQREVETLVQQTRQRSGWSARETLSALGVSRASYYRWLKDRKWQAAKVDEPVRLAQAYEATEQEQQKVWAYALKHPAMRHREVAWRMVDEGVACLSGSTVYRIVREKQLVCPWRRRRKRSRLELEKAQRPDERWGTDLMQIQIHGRPFYLLTFIDEYSRYLVHYELLTNMEGATVS